MYLIYLLHSVSAIITMFVLQSQCNGHKIDTTVQSEVVTNLSDHTLTEA